MSRLTVSGLWKAYGETEVLCGVELAVEHGSLTAVLGLSGCGKTTLLRVIAGFERAERGRVVLGGTTLDDGRSYLPPEKRGIGYVPQEGALFPHLSVRENIAFGLPRSERRGRTVDALLEMVALAPLAQRLPHELSGGEQQRVALARALARRPQALLLDEPFSSLDASLRTHLREEVHGLLREQGVTTVLVTHDQEEALSLADAVAVMRDGRIIQQGVPTDLYEQPIDDQLAGFLGDVNLIEADLRGDTARTQLGTLMLREGAAPPPPGTRPASGTVLVRPEQLQVSVRGDRRDGSTLPAGVGGRVELCRYYGHDALLYIRPDAPGAKLLLARVHGGAALAAGTQVLVAARGFATRLGAVS